MMPQRPSVHCRSRPAVAPAAVACAVALALTFATAGCELTEVTTAEPHDVVVAEVLIQSSEAQVLASALLYATQGSEDPGRVREARVLLTPEGGDAVELPRVNPSVCLDFRPREPVTERACYASTALAGLAPGTLVDLVIGLPDGEEMRGSTRTVGRFDVAGAWAGAGAAPGGTPDGVPVCYLAPWTTFALTWTQAEGAWGYLIESWIHGLPEALAAHGIAMNQDPLFLVGLALSAADTIIVFPSQIGVADRIDDESGVLLALRDGLPAGADASIHVAAADRNFVRWFRGGTFNPSGPARISSLTGDGFGYFGSTAVRSVAVTTRPSQEVPPCGPM